MTASSYPDDGIGEVFLKLGKQGSALADVMDAFSMAISVGLQYGIFRTGRRPAPGQRSCLRGGSDPVGSRGARAAPPS
jgi:hypothetical protein